MVSVLRPLAVPSPVHHTGAGGQADVQQLDEEQEHPEREHQTEPEIAPDANAAEAARDTGEQHDPGDDETGPADERHVREKAGRDPAESGGAESMLATLARLVRRRAAPATRERLEREPHAEYDDSGADDAWDEIRPDPGITAFRRQARGNRRYAQAEREHAQRKRYFRHGAAGHWITSSGRATL